jgi:serine/threonine protein kinase
VVSGIHEIDLGIDGLTDYRPIGYGGFADVYQAYDEGFGRKVAVKVLNAVDATGRRRFEREQRSMGRVETHPNVVTALSSGYTRYGDKPYVVMEHLGGGSLQDLMQSQGPLPLEDALDLVIPIAEALGHIHARGVIHKDLKPANILLSASGVPKLADFGIASVMEATTTTEIAYSPPYAAPETFHVAGTDTPDIRDERSDLYSLAATLYALVVGTPPFHSEENNTPAGFMARILRTPVGSTGEPALDGFLQRAMAKDPAARFQIAAAFAEHLRTIRGSSSSTGASPETKGSTGGAALSRAGGTALRAGGAHLVEWCSGWWSALVRGGSVGWSSGRSSVSDRWSALSSRSLDRWSALSSRSLDRWSALSSRLPDGWSSRPVILGLVAVIAAVSVAIWGLAVSDGPDPAGAGSSGTDELSSEALDDDADPAGPGADPAADDETITDPESTAIPSDDTEPQAGEDPGGQLIGDDPTDDGAADGDPVSGDPAAGGSTGEPGGATTAGAGATEPVVYAGHRDLAGNARGDAVVSVVELDGGRLVTGGADGTAQVWQPGESGARLAVYSGHSGVVRYAVGLGDGRIASASWDSTVHVWDPASPGAPAARYTGHGRAVFAVLALSDGRVASAGEESEIHLWDPDDPDGGAVRYAGHSGGIRSMIQLDDGRIASASLDDTVRIWDPDDLDGPAVVYDGHSGDVHSVAGLADGRIASGGADGTVHVWDPDDVDGPAVVYDGHTADVWSVAVTADGRIASSGLDRTAHVWDPGDPAASAVVYREHTGWVWSVAGLSDGRVASASADGTVQIWHPDRL